MSYKAYRAAGASLAAMKKIYKQDTDAFKRARKIEAALGPEYMVEWRDHKGVGVRIDWEPLNNSNNNFKYAMKPRARPKGWVDHPEYPGVVIPPPGSAEEAEFAKMQLGDMRKEKAICPNGPTIVVNNHDEATYPRAYGEYPWVFTGRDEDEFFICVPEDYKGNATPPRDAVELTPAEHAKEAQHWGGFRDPEWMEKGTGGVALPADYPVKAPDTSKHNRRYFKAAGQSLALLQMLDADIRNYEQQLADFQREHEVRSPATDQNGQISGFYADRGSKRDAGWKELSAGNGYDLLVVPDTTTLEGRIIADEIAMIGARPEMSDYPQLCGNSDNGPYSRELDGTLYMEVFLKKDGSYHTPPDAAEVPVADYLALLQDVLDREQRHITPPPAFDKSRLPKPKPAAKPLGPRR